MIFSVKFANTLFNFLKKGPPYGAFNYNLGFSALLGHPPVKNRVVLETSYNLQKPRLENIKNHKCCDLNLAAWF